MFFEISRKIVGPVVFGDEVEVGDRGGGEGSKDRVFSRITDGCGGESIHEIGIIRARTQQIFFGQISVKVFDSIDHRGIALKGHPFFQTIVENG